MLSESSALLEISRSAIEDARRSRADITEMADKAREDVKEMAAQMAQSARDDVKELTKMMLEREDKMALKLEQLRQEQLSPRPAQTDGAQAGGWGLPSWGIGGWLLRLVVLYVVLRWRRLAMLIGRAFGPRAPLRVS